MPERRERAASIRASACSIARRAAFCPCFKRSSDNTVSMLVLAAAAASISTEEKRAKRENDCMRVCCDIVSSRSGLGWLDGGIQRGITPSARRRACALAIVGAYCDFLCRTVILGLKANADKAFGPREPHFY